VLRIGKFVPAIAVWLAALVATSGALANAMDTPSVPTPASASATTGSQPPADADYLIGPGDTIRVFVLGSPELNAEVPVRPDGKISTPLVADMVAVGKTPSQLARDMEKVLAEYIRTPNVSVIVSNPTSSFSQIRVVGQAVSPRAIPYRRGLTVLDAVLQVGGLSKFAAGNRAKIVRQVGGKTEDVRVRLDDLIDKGDIRQNLELQPGDILVIPEARF
jgi:polysaccharide export outer membrane protein